MPFTNQPLSTRVALDRQRVVDNLPPGDTLGTIAAHANLPAESLSRAFSGERPITLSTASIIAHRLGVPVEDIVQTCDSCHQPLPAALAVHP